ncbi:MFS transporter [Bacillus alkalicellulosilyticus]|uniref:MFS transporter n=1 Tax=Alkalihalobacterium alkalicellulosilyticum TaxID=1912214 RepID=UPI0009964609|nr:MFS transporter [Bacillus alkalicellulosilyticus]
MKELRILSPLMIYLFFAYANLMIFASYMPVYYQHKGLSETDIGWLLAVGPFATIFAQPIWGFLSDKYKSYKKMILWSLSGAVLVSFIVFSVNTFWAFMLSVFLIFLFIPPLTALGDSLAQKTAAERNISFGQLRMWGSLGFGICTLIVGFFLSKYGIQYVMVPYWILAALLCAAALSLKDIKSTNKPVTLFTALQLKNNKKLMYFLAIIMLVSISHRANDSFLGIYIISLGGDESLIGSAWFVGVISETIILATSAWWFRRFHPLTFITIAAALYSMRWFFMASITEPGYILLFQAFHGVTFGLFYICAFHFVTKLVPEEIQATGHVLFITVFFGVSGIIGSLFGGWMIESFGHSPLYQYLGISSIIGVVCLVGYRKWLDRLVENEDIERNGAST